MQTPNSSPSPSSPRIPSSPASPHPHDPLLFPPANPISKTDNAYLDAAEQDLVQQIHLLQRKLTESRQRQALRKNRGLLRRNPSVSENILSLAASQRRNHTTPPERPNRQRIISVSLRLPTVQHRRSARQQLFHDGLPPKAIFSLQAASDFPFLFVGTTPPGTHPHSFAFEHLYGDQHRTSWRSANHRHRSQPSQTSGPCVPVTLPDEPQLLERYNVYCEHVLWRLLHYDYSSVGSDTDLEEYWNAYRIVNQRFAETISEIYEDGDLIWVHDYHLMLLPSLLRESLWYAKIGFFLYTPFPSAELFRILPHRAEILKGVIGSDIIGFHSYEYSKQFVASCSRLLGLDGTPSAIEADHRTGRRCELGIYPAGIDVHALRNHVSSKTVKSRVAELRARFEGLKIVVGFDRLDDAFGGIPLKLLAFEQLLVDNPDLIGRVILIEIAMIPQHSRNMASYRSQQIQVNEFVGRINSNFGTLAFSPVHYVNAELDPIELHALMCAGHVCVVSTVRDGMGLVPHEWTVCQHSGHKGPIVLSEFAGAAHNFSTALHVNPWNVDEVASKIKIALEMSESSRIMRNEAAYRFVTSHTAKLWGFNFLEDLQHCERVTAASGYSGNPMLDTAVVLSAYHGTSALPSPLSSNTMLSSMNHSYSQASVSPLLHGDQISSVILKAFGPTTSPTALPAEQMKGIVPDSVSPERVLRTPKLAPVKRTDLTWVSPDASGQGYHFANRAKAFILDLDGTLVPFQAMADLAAPSQTVTEVISALRTADPLNFVLVLSSRDRTTLMQWLGGLDVYLAAEDGAFFRAPGDSTWTSLFRDTSALDYSHHPNPIAAASHQSGNKVNSTTSTLGKERNMARSPPPQNGKVDDTRSECSESISEHEVTQREFPGTKPSDAHRKAASNSLASLSSVESAQNGETGIQKWKSVVLPVMQHFAERTPGVVLEEGDATLTWYYTDSDPDFGMWQSRDLYKHLESFLLQRQSIDLISEEGRQRWIKVRPSGVNKSLAVAAMLRHISKASIENLTDENKNRKETPYVDFVLCIGDDRADDGMLEFVRDEEKMEEVGVHCSQNRVFTCLVGSSSNSAGTFLDSPSRALEVLEDISGHRSGNRL